MVREEALTFLPRFAIFVGGAQVGQISKAFTFFKPLFHLDCMGWRMEGNFLAWDYAIIDAAGTEVATISKELLHWTDTYALDVVDPKDALYVLMIALAIDAAKCSGGA